MRPSNDHAQNDARQLAGAEHDPLGFEEMLDSSGAGEPLAEADGHDAGAPARGFAAWYRGRPLVGGAITVIAGLALYFSSQLELGHLTVHVGVEGMQATILPIVLALTGVLAIAMPAHRVFYGVIALVVAVYSLVAVNLGGFFVGFLLGCVGGVMVVSWAPRDRRRGADGTGDEHDLGEGGAAAVEGAAVRR